MHLNHPKDHLARETEAVLLAGIDEGLFPARWLCSFLYERIQPLQHLGQPLPDEVPRGGVLEEVRRFFRQLRLPG